MSLFRSIAGLVAFNVSGSLSVQCDCGDVFQVERLFQVGTVERSVEHSHTAKNSFSAEFAGFVSRDAKKLTGTLFAKSL